MCIEAWDPLGAIGYRAEVNVDSLLIWIEGESVVMSITGRLMTPKMTGFTLSVANVVKV